LEAAEWELGRELEPGWTVRSRALPDQTKSNARIQKQLDCLADRLKEKRKRRWERKALKACPKATPIERERQVEQAILDAPMLHWKGFSTDKLTRAWRRETQGKEQGVTEAELGILSKAWEPLTGSPIDKYAGDGCLI